MNILRIILLSLGWGYLPVADASDVRLDHVIIAVEDLEQASHDFRGLGFNLKPGRKHKNGLVNAFIKFADNTEIELMSVQGKPGDSTAKSYARFLETAQGGAFIAFTGYDIQTLSKRLQALKIEHRVQRGRLWDYIVFPEDSGLAQVFFIKHQASVAVDPALYSHRNSASGIANVWLESSASLLSLLQALGAKNVPKRIGFGSLIVT